jgi:imidazolonepropionase-like amidohydrolase
MARFAVVLAVALISCFPARSSTQATSIVFEGVAVIPMDRERTMANHTVVVTGDRIAAIGAANAVTVPPGATRIDARGKFLMPALAEMHAHVPGSANPGNSPDAERVLFLYAANGIGTIRSMLGDASHFALRDRARRGEIVAPSMYLAGPSFSGQSVSSPQAASSRVEQQKQAGYDLLKIHPGVPRDAFDALAATAARVGIPFAGHVPAAVGVQRALEAKYSTIDHLDGYIEALAGPGAPASQTFGVNLVDRVDESRMPALVQATRAAGTGNVPTQILLETWFGMTGVETMRQWPEMRYADPSDVNEWVGFTRDNVRAYSADHRRRFIDIRRRLIKALHDGGTTLLLGSDAPQIWNVPGFSAHRELEAYVAAGLTPYQALATGTRNVAMHFGTLDRTGTVDAGKRADLLLLDANPLEQITNTTRIAGVMIGGRWLPRADLDRRLQSGR